MALIVSLSLVALFVPPAIEAEWRDAADDTADESIEQFLEKGDSQPAYRATRRLEAHSGNRHGWMDVVTEYAPDRGFSYQVTAEGGSDYIRQRVLRVVLDGEREAIAKGGTSRSALVRSNYRFEPNGVDADGLAKVLLSPRRKEHLLVEGAMFLQPADGALVRVQGRLAKSPSFWVKRVDIIRSYQRIDNIVVPVALESNADIRIFGDATLRMTYAYTEINGRQVGAPAPASAVTRLPVPHVLTASP